MTSNRSVSEMVERELRQTIAAVLGDARVEAECSWLELADRIIDALPTVNVAALSSQAQSDDVVERARQLLSRHTNDLNRRTGGVVWVRYDDALHALIDALEGVAIPPAGGVEERLREALVEARHSLNGMRFGQRVDLTDAIERIDATLNESSAIGGGDGR